MKRRLSYIDNAKGIGILIVILAHMYEPQSPVRVFAYAFHMPLFFLIAGMMGNYTEEHRKSFPEILIRKCKTLLIPYFFFEIIAISGYLLISKNFSCGAVVNGIKNSVLLFCSAGATWFLPTLFVAEMVFYILFKYIKTEKHILWTNIFLWVLIVYVPSQNHYLAVFSKSMVAVSFYSFGFFINGKLDNWNFERIFLLIVLFTVSMVVNGQVDLFYLDLGIVPLYIISSITGSLLVILLCKRYLDTERKILKFFGQNSMIVMGTHLFVFYGIFRDYLGIPLFVPQTAGILFLCICLLEIPICLVINRFFPFAIGKSRRKIEITEQRNNDPIISSR